MKTITLLSLLVIASIIGGLYGALYDQFTYSISPEFYTKMRFPLYGISYTENIRWEVAKIGFKNAWSVGLILGLFMSLAGLLHENYKKMIIYTLQSFGITLFTAFVFGLIAYYMVAPDVNQIKDTTIVDKLSFARVSGMTNYSYIGGTIGMFIGLAWQVFHTGRKK